MRGRVDYPKLPVTQINDIAVGGIADALQWERWYRKRRRLKILRRFDTLVGVRSDQYSANPPIDLASVSVCSTRHELSRLH